MNEHQKNELITIDVIQLQRKYSQKNFASGIQNHIPICIWPADLKYKDINDIIISGKTSTEVQTLISNNTHCGLTALQHINNWKRI